MKKAQIHIAVTDQEKVKYNKAAKKAGFKTLTGYIYYLLNQGVKLILIMSLISLAGCATLFKQKERVVDFNSDPQGAAIYINGNRMGNTPLPIKLSNKKSVTVTFRKDGYEDKSYIINANASCGWVILDILGGFIPVVIDAVSENWYNLDAKEVNVLLDVKAIDKPVNNLVTPSALPQ